MPQADYLDLLEFSQAELAVMYVHGGGLRVLKAMAATTADVIVDPYGSFDAANRHVPSSARPSRVAVPGEAMAARATAYYQSRVDHILSVACEKCGVAPNEPCIYPNKAKALSSHLVRRKLGRALHQQEEEHHGNDPAA